MDKETKQKTILWTAITITAINLLLVLSFIVYLYFWLRNS